MAKKEIILRMADNILGEIEQLQRAVRERAYELFRNNGAGLGTALSDWLNAERELVWTPAIELRRSDGRYEVLAATAGVPAKALEVQTTPEDLLIKADVHHEHTAKAGDVQVCEFKRGHLFRSVHFPEKIDPGSVKAEYKDGLLRVTASIAKAAPTHVQVSPA